MNAENILQSKLNKVKSFIDNESFVFTFSKTNAFAINKDQLFKNQVYNTYIDHNGYEINERKNSPVIKNEKIIQISDNNILFNSSRIVIKDMGKNIVYEPKENEFEINSKKFKIKENISKIDNANGKIFYNDDNKIKSIDILNLNNLTIHFEDKDKPFKPFKLYKSTIPFDVITFDSYNIFIDDHYYEIGTHNLENKKHIILCQDVEMLKNVTINKGESLINYIVETSESESNFKFDKALERTSSDIGYIELYNNEVGTIKVASIKKLCTGIEFAPYNDYDYTSSCKIQLYIDRKYYTTYDNLDTTRGNYVTIGNLSYDVHEFTWVFIADKGINSCPKIDSISFYENSTYIGDLTDDDLITNNYENDILGQKYINNEIKENSINNTITIKGLGFYKISKLNDEKKLYLYYDYKDDQYEIKYCRCIIDNKTYDLKRGINLIETEATDIYIEILCDKEIVFSVLTDNHIYNKNELIKNNKDQASIVLYSDEYKNGDNSSTPFYNDTIGFKVVSIKKTCSKMSFYYKTRYSSSSNYVYLYIDGKYYNKYSDSSWTLASIDNLTNKEHEFTWVLYNTNDHDYSCIDTISFNDVVETDSSLFSNTYDNELRNEFYKNGYNLSTPFYNDTTGSKVVSIKKTCSKMSFYYKTKYDNKSSYVYLYIDGKYYNEYYNKNTWTLITVNNLSNKEHEFTWVLYNNTDDGNYSCIDTISFDDTVETDSSLFSNTYDNELKNINSEYKNGDNSSTPFYNDAAEFKVISIKKTCSKMSFYYKTRYSSSSNYVCLYIDGKYYNEYSNSSWTLASIDNLSNKEHEFTWVLYNYTNNYYSCIDTISFNDVVETNSSLFSNTYDNELKNINSTYKNGSNSSTPFYNDAIGFKVISIKKTCSKMSFYYKTRYSSSSNYVYLYIDGKYYNNRYSDSDNTWSLTTVNNLSNKEHEFTWVLYNTNDRDYSCIDTISFDDVVETDSSLFSNTYDNELKNININSTYKNGDNSSTPFYNDTTGFKVVSIKKTCSKMSFYYKTKYNDYNDNFISLYIDGKYYNKYSDSSWRLASIDNLSNKEHEFTWVLYSNTDGCYSCIDTISFNGVVETDSSLFSNTYDNELKNNNNSEYKNGDNSSTPFYNDATGFKVVSIKKTCSKMSFYYKTKNSSFNYVYLYIDGKYYNNRYSDNTWSLTTVNNLSNKEHEFTWVLYNNTDGYYSCIDTISFDDVVETNSSLFSNTYDNELLKNEFYKNGYNSSTPFYNDAIGSKVISIKKTCSKMSFYYKTKNSSFNYVYLYIDGKYYNKYKNINTWSLASIDNLSNKEHEFTWVLYSNIDDYGYYSCIDTISFNDVVETDSSLFSNTYDNELLKNEFYKNGYNSSTPFYNDTIGSKVISIKKTCSKMSFYYKTKDNNSYYNYVYLYIDGKYYNKYSNNGAWTLASIDNLSNKEHEFTWVLHSNTNGYYLCIDTISFNGVVETNSSLFSNKGTLQLPEIADNNNYKNGSNSSTPFYNDTIGFKVVSIKKTCSKMSFYYKTKCYRGYYSYVYLYIDGKYYNEYKNINTWSLASIDNLSNKEHEFTWVLYNYTNNYYSCIDTISFNDVVETNSSLFSNTYDNELQNEFYKNGDNSSTPFYNDATGFKVVSIKKTCSKMSFYYKTKYSISSKFICLYIDGKYYNEYSDSSWTLASIDNLTNKEHEFTWVLYNTNGFYSCIDTISFDDVVETNSSLFSNKGTLQLPEIANNNYYKNGSNSSTPFYNDTIGSKVISIKKTCSKMSFYYKTRYNNNSYSYVCLYIDGKYYNEYYNKNTWTLASIDNLSNKEHEFTWVLHDYTNKDYSCIDTIAFNDVVETDSSLFSNTYDNELKNNNNNEYKNEDNSSTPFYNNTIGSKVISIKKTCSKMSFYYKTKNNSDYNYVYLYIDGNYYNEYYNSSYESSWKLASIDNLSNKEHEFTWVLYNTDDYDDYSCIDTISFNDVVETNSSLFSTTYDNELRNEFYKNGDNSSTPFYNNTIGSKVVSIKKTCSKMSFYYKTKYYNYDSFICLYIDGKYYNEYSNNGAWTLASIDNLSNKEHEFTWVLHSNNTINKYYSCIDTISFNDVIETNSSLFSNTYDNELKNINSKYKNGSNSSTPFYNDTIGSKVISIKKTCSKMSFYYKTGYNNKSSYVYLYIDGKYYNEYSDSSWRLASIDNLSNKEHEFTWVLYSNTDDYGYYSCIDTISFNGVVETDSSLFSNTYDNELKNINSTYKNRSNSSTPFYNDAIGSKVVSIKKTCSKMSFYYKTKNNSSVYNFICLYIDGKYYNEYSDSSWTLASINNLSNKEHEFTWVLYSNTDGYYSCIDTISFDDVVETDSSLFSNTYDNELKNIISTYKNGDNSSTPFYNDAIGSKVISIKKTCSKMSFYYKTRYYSSYSNYVYLYIDGKYYNKYSNNDTWELASIDNLSNKEHEFTWVLYNYTDGCYSCIDTISFNDVVETNSSLFSNTYDNELKNNNISSAYKNGSNSSTPFYNDATGFKVISIKKTCSKMSFYYKTRYSSYSNYVYLYIDGKYYNEYSDSSWTLASIDNLTNKEHEFTWVLYNYTDDDYSCIDTISFNDVVETNSSLFSNTYDNELQNEITVNPFYFYNDAFDIKVVSIKKTCSKMSFYYKTRHSNYNDNFISLYIDGKYYNKYKNNDTWELASIDNLSNKEHEFTWVLCNIKDDIYYSCIDTISFNDVVETNSSLFSNNIEYFVYKNENYIEVQNDNKIIDFCIFNNLLNRSEYFLYYINNNYNLYRRYSYYSNNYSEEDQILNANENIKIKNILNVQSIEYHDYSSGIINILFLLDKNNILKILIDDRYVDDPYYDGTIYDELFPILEEEFKDKEIKDIVCDNPNNDRIVTIYILTKSGEVYEWSTNSYETDDNGITSIIYERIKYDNIRFVDMKKTEYGIILLGEDGKLYVKGKFVNGEFGLYNTSSITIDGKEYSKAFVSDKLVRISRDEFLEDGEYKLRNIYTLKLYNTDAYDSGVYVVKEDGKLYYTGKNNGACGEVFGYPFEAQNIDVWTPVENNTNDIGRISTPRPDYWSYYFDYIMKSDKNGSGNSVENIFFKIDDVWIDWNAYISKYMNVTLRDADNKILKKYKEFKKTDNSTLRKVINFDSFIEYLKLNKESITNEFKVDRTLIPQVDYIDKDLNVYIINAGDNISCIKYSQKDIDLLNADLIESLNHNIQLKNEYEDVIEKSQDPEEIFEYQNRLAVIELNIEELNKEIANNQDKLGTMNPNNYFDFNDNRIFNPMTVVGTEEKTINYSKSNFSEPNENGEIEIETEEIDGALHVVKSTVSKTVESNITKLKINLINYDRLNNSSISDAEVLRDDIKMTIMEDPNDERNFEVDDLLVWLNGKFITKDYIIGNDNKAFCNYNGLAEVETRRICEFPGYGEPTQNSDNIPTITGENATVIEPTVPTELRWNLSPKVFSWEDVKINGPYKIHDLNNVNSELRRVELFYFGDVYCSVFTQFLIKNKICPKNTFILFFNGAIVPEDEYDVSIKGNNTYITLKKFTAYVTSLLQDEVDIMKPGYEGRVRHILSQFDNMSQFSIAFLSSTDKFKKVKMYYDYQTIRDVPKPGQVIFNDIKYNDLILFDGCYIPYLWESRNCIRIPETVNTIRTSENNFIRHSTICRARPYSTYKKESELTDTECRMYAKQNGLLDDEELLFLDITYIRERIKPHIEARIKEI